VRAGPAIELSRGQILGLWVIGILFVIGGGFYFGPVALTVPQKVAFIGKSNQGTFSGHYKTRTGEVDATVSYGGYSVAGMVDIRRPQGTFHLVGRVVNGKREFEIDRKKTEMINPTAQ